MEPGKAGSGTEVPRRPPHPPRHPARPGRLLLLVLLLLPAAARADDLQRFADRWFYGLELGASWRSASALTRLGPADQTSRWQEFDGLAPGWLVGVGLGVRPWEAVTLQLGLQGGDFGWQPLGVAACEVAGQPTPAGSCAAPGVGGHGWQLRFGPELQLALPLRYVAPYVGLGPGLHLHYLDGEAAGWGARFELRLLAGLQLYLSRDLRLTLSYARSEHDLTTSRDDAAAEAGTLSWTGVRQESFTLGLTGTPKSYKQSPSKPTWLLVPALVASTVAGLGLAAALAGR
ncbi:MAG: hypothetical protein RBU45_21640 [Myxococcota bacterium]|nr:hypothetical protein [Myxococcota bacterium]